MTVLLPAPAAAAAAAAVAPAPAAVAPAPAPAPAAGPAPVVRADPRRLKQALLVMLNNSARYADAGTEIVVEVGTDSSGRAEIAVRDQGQGLQPDEVSLVFERFFRGSRAIEDGGGSGLGLPIARWIVERHDGELGLSSTPGVGTEVRVSLPVAA